MAAGSSISDFVNSQGSAETHGDDIPGQVGIPSNDAPASTETPTNQETQLRSIGLGEQSQETPAETLANLSLQVPPDTVIAHDDKGNPVTAAEVQRGFMRQSDYTQKTQAVAAEKQAVAELTQWGQRIFQSDEASAIQAFRDLAAERGIDLAAAFREELPRNPDGTWMSRQDAQNTQNIVNPDDYEEGSPAYAMAQMVNALQSKYDALEGNFSKLVGGIQSQFNQAQTQSEIESIASDWSRSGFTGADASKAFPLVGTAITAAQAMVLANFAELVQHNIQAHLARPTAKPNEPSRDGTRPGIDPSGMSITQFARSQHGL